jgi:hypothetical protein
VRARNRSAMKATRQLHELPGRKAMPRKSEQPATSDMGPQELTEDVIRMRAYSLFEQRGGGHGNDVDDWLQAEAEVMGKKPGASAGNPERAQDAAA